MEYFSDSYNSNSSSTPSQFASYQEVGENRAKTTSSSIYSSLHAVRKLPLKPMKKPIAPLPPVKPKVYKVDSVNFKHVVQRLTSAPEFQPNDPQEAEEVAKKVLVAPTIQTRRLEEVVPPALDLSSNTQLLPAEYDGRMGGLKFPSSPNSSQIPANFSEFISSERKHRKFSETCGAPPSPPGFSFSPSSSWCLSPLLMSPGTLSFLD